MSNSFYNQRECLEQFLKCRIIGESGNITINETCRDIVFQQNACRRAKNISTTDKVSNLELTDPDLTLALVVCLLTVAILSFVANGFVCIVFALVKEIRSGQHYFIVNLAVADILIATFAIPLFVVAYFYTRHGTVTFCQIGSVIDLFCCTLSIVNFAAISLERFIAIKYPLRYPSIVSSRRRLWAVVFVWFYSTMTAVFSLLPIGQLRHNHCVFFSDGYIVTITFTTFLLPLITMSVAYGFIFKIAKYQARQIRGNTPNRDSCLATMRSEYKAAKTLTLIIGVYIVCWLPFIIYIAIFTVFGVSTRATGLVPLFHVVHVLRFVNSLANPFIYVGINNEFRRKSFKLLNRWRGRVRNPDMEFSTRSDFSTQSSVLRPAHHVNNACDSLELSKNK